MADWTPGEPARTPRRTGRQNRSPWQCNAHPDCTDPAVIQWQHDGHSVFACPTHEPYDPAHQPENQNQHPEAAPQESDSDRIARLEVAIAELLKANGDH